MFRTVQSTREAFGSGTKVLIAIGGWGDTGFSIAAHNPSSRRSFAKNIAKMVKATDADGMFCLPLLLLEN